MGEDVTDIRKNAANQNQFRDLNERVMEVNARFGDADGHTVEVFCECGRQGCAERVAITRTAYEHVRSDGSTFAMVAGHEVGIVEEIIERGPDYVIARNVGLAEGIARDADPRG